VDPCCHVIATCSFDVGPSDIFNGKSRRVAALAGINAWRDIDWLVDVAKLKVAESNIAYASLARISLDPSGVGRVVAFEILEQNVIDVVWAVPIAQRANNCAPALIAGHVAHVDVFAVAFNGNAVLAENKRVVDVGVQGELTS